MWVCGLSGRKRHRKGGVVVVVGSRQLMKEAATTHATPSGCRPGKRTNDPYSQLVGFLPNEWAFSFSGFFPNTPWRYYLDLVILDKFLSLVKYFFDFLFRGEKKNQAHHLTKPLNWFIWFLLFSSFFLDLDLSPLKKLTLMLDFSNSLKFLFFPSLLS